MEMKIDNQSIRARRASRAWSQEQLASAAGLSLRTIQRIESNGIASNESAQALAAVFDCKIADLVGNRSAKKFWTTSKSLRIGAAFSMGTLLGVLLTSGLTASAVDLTVHGYLNGQPRVSIKETSGSPMSIPILDTENHERARVNIEVSELRNGQIRFDLALFDCQSGSCVPAGRPSMITDRGKPAKVEWGSNVGDVITYEITPTD